MSLPLLWPAKTFFYPIGNTPAAHLTAALPPETPADILLLGCGDVRNVLFTIYMESASSQRKLDITCNDHEPAILTRNLLLYTMLLDEPDSNGIDEIWNIYHHFYLDNVSLQRLYAQCRKVLQITNDLNDWNDHKYGQVLRFSSDGTLQTIRRHLELYLEIKNLPAKAKMELETSFSSEMSKVYKQHWEAGKRGSFGARAAGPFFLLVDGLGGKHAQHFWQTGLSAGTQKSTCPNINPTFAYSRSGKGFNAHYGTDPVVAFHLAPSFAHCDGSVDTPVKTIVQLAAFAKTQFRAWCDSFKIRARQHNNSLHIRLLIGDALSASKALHCYQAMAPNETGIYEGQWGGTKINLYPVDYSIVGDFKCHQAPPSFNIINTSNLYDHLGILNLLVVTVPLLRHTPESTLDTHALVKDETATHRNSLYDVGMDVPLLSVLFGVVPARILSNVTTTSTMHEAMGMDKSVSVRQFHDPLVWKRMPNCEGILTRVGCDPIALGNALFSIYEKMFEDESVSSKIHATMGRKAGIDPRTLAKHMGTMSVLYNRTSFAEFLFSIRPRVLTNWEEAMDHFVHLLETDSTLLVGLSNYQDIMCHLSLRDLYTSPAIKTPISGQPQGSHLHSGSWRDGVVPQVVCVVLVVPRDRLRKLEAMEPDDIRTPTLLCHTKGPTWHNMHSSVRPIFGTVQETHTKGMPVKITEDPLGWKGRAPLILSFYIPTWLLQYSAPHDTQIVVGFKPLPLISLCLLPALGPYLEIFQTTLDDRKRVFVCESRPDNPTELHTNTLRYYGIKAADTAGQGGDKLEDVGLSTELVFAPGNKPRLQSIGIKALFVDHKKRQELAKAETGVSRVNDKEADHETVLRYGCFSQTFKFPFPVDILSLKIQLARKSSYLRVEAPVQFDPEMSKEGFSNPFRVLTHSPPLCLNMHYTRLDQLPVLKDAPCSTSTWEHLTACGLLSTYSTKETAERNNPSQRKAKYSLKDVKDTIDSLFRSIIMRKGSPFQCSIAPAGDCPNNQTNFIIFVNALRLDLNACSIVLDACLLEFSKEMVNSNPRLYATIQALDRVHTVDVTIAEMVLWKKMIPALVERCRTWSHKENCAYAATGGTIPLSVDLTKGSLCDCGKGLDLGPFNSNPDYRAAAPFVVRIGICPIFPSNSEASALFNAFDGNSSGPSSKPAPTSGPVCRICSKPGNPTLLTCSRCKATKYCSAACQKADWKDHKRICAK
ncbi:hypothetical protein FA15DRAFT_664645 [Coprinopsis marcescibilis]|uniref:MYND-type domain-containing protein n=1 Tax=Coprinopsis marcescibilis TaxID=230819 RepID=A0A5C3L8B6_COPMA|nr:hypothetical protein FA15DRAFT_664645 [Coprinopsis marcescibilis]